MSAIFNLNHVNIMAYVTSRSYAPPRVPRQHLEEFLEAFAYQSERYLIPEHGREFWPKKIAELAHETLIRFHKSPSYLETIAVSPQTLKQLLENLQNVFAAYPLYALAVGSGEQLKEEARELARSPMHGQLLLLIPENEVTKRNFEMLDPVPAFSTALHAAPDWPGFVFWTQTGVSAFVKVNEVNSLFNRLYDARYKGDDFPFPEYASFGFDYVLKEWSKQTLRMYRRLLHLSDLHFGTEEATENQAILDSELSDIVKNVDRVVITGDVFDTPKKNYATLFTTFENNITRLSGGIEPVVITGNHDQKMIGLFGENYKQVARIGSRKIVVDDRCKMIFICFNSSEKGYLARGRITNSQFRQRGGDYRTLIATRPELKSYLPIVLVHHHPFSFKVPPETLVQKALNWIGIEDETFLVLANSEELQHWCLDWNIKTILHGHKHKARYVQQEVTRGKDSIFLTAIGCGSSLGAEGSPVSYNLLEWEPGAQRWVASFFESINGGAFREKETVVSPPQ